MELIDTHCHLDFKEFDEDRDEVIQQAHDHGVKNFVVPGVQAASWKRLIQLAKDKGFYYALGLHPYFVDQHSDEDLTRLIQLVEKSAPVAIGEIGLDFYDKNADRQRQQHFFTEQVKIAQQFTLPIIVHARKSLDEIIKLIKEIGFSRGGIIHAFNGSLQQAEKLIHLGFKLGFGGMLTYEKSSHLRKLARELPLDAIVLETDAPDMTGKEHHGQRNSPAYIPEVVAALAEIRFTDARIIGASTTENAIQVLQLKD